MGLGVHSVTSRRVSRFSIPKNPLAPARRDALNRAGRADLNGGHLRNRHPFRRRYGRAITNPTARPAPAGRVLVPELPEAVPHERVQRALAALLRSKDRT